MAPDRTLCGRLHAQGPVLTSHGLFVDFLGFTINASLYCNEDYMRQDVAHALRKRQCDVYAICKATHTDAGATMR